MTSTMTTRRAFLAGLGGVAALAAGDSWLDAMGYAQSRGPATPTAANPANLARNPRRCIALTLLTGGSLLLRDVA